MIDLIESRFTVPRDDCPHPEWWHSVDDESTELEVSELVASFVRALQPDLVVESGTAYGQTARAIGHALKANGHGSLLTYEIDQRRASIALARCVGLPVLLFTVPFRPTVEGIGFAWIDGHIDERVADLESCRPLFALGAIVGVHDSSPFHGIRPALEALDWIRWIHLPTPRGVMFGQVLP